MNNVTWNDWWWGFNGYFISPCTSDEYAKNVGEESRKTWINKFETGFFKKYMSGKGLDIGGTGYLENVHAILPSAIIVGLDYPGYNGRTLPFADNSQDYVYSSHMLEHVSDYKNMIQEQFRVTKPNGHIVIVVPHKFLYEKKEELPSIWNQDHKRFYTPASLLKEIEDSLQPNTYRIRHLQDNDLHHDYQQSAEEHSKGQYECEVVIQKL